MVEILDRAPVDDTGPETQHDTVGHATGPVALRQQASLFRFWEARRGAAAMPRRDAFDLPDLPPAAIPGAILFGVEPGAPGAPPRFRIRYAGNQHAEILGREIGRRTVTEAIPLALVRSWLDPLSWVAGHGQPHRGMDSLAGIGKPYITMHWLRLPLAGADGAVTCILGHDAFVWQNRAG
ncbi:PAS domain-containing protein [Roseospira navarrensis]|nr:PAS domain-containing protein [Roseospira navarrensis]